MSAVDNLTVAVTYAKIHPRDRHRTVVYASKTTIEARVKEIEKKMGPDFIWPGVDPAIPMIIFGLPLRIDDAVPDGEFHFMIRVE